MEKYTHLLSKLSLQLTMKPIPVDWKGIDIIWEFVERIKEDGATVIIKVDGGRTAPNDNGCYTILITGENLENNPIRTDAYALEDALAYGIANYAKRFWGFLDF